MWCFTRRKCHFWNCSRIQCLFSCYFLPEQNTLATPLTQQIVGVCAVISSRFSCVMSLPLTCQKLARYPSIWFFPAIFTSESWGNRSTRVQRGWHIIEGRTSIIKDPNSTMQQVMQCKINSGNRDRTTTIVPRKTHAIIPTWVTQNSSFSVQQQFCMTWFERLLFFCSQI